VPAWSIQQAKACFSWMLKTCLRERAQVLIKGGADVAFLAATADWDRLQHAEKSTLKALLLTNEALGELNIPARGGRRRRQVRVLR
jgi:antitoxin Phd